MGTRADFYMGRGPDAEWLGSIAWDGDDGTMRNDGMRPEYGGDQWRGVVTSMFSERDDFTPPSQGWPWPWKDSGTTNYAYAWDDGVVYWSYFGGEWVRIGTDLDDDEHDALRENVAVFPDMSDRQNVQLGGPGSGLIVIGPA